MHATELAILEARLITDPANAETVKRRIADVKAAMKAETPVEVAETTEADHGDIETATLPKPKRGR